MAETRANASPARRAALALLWVLALVLLAGWAADTLKVSGDLRLFMPAPRTAEQRLLLQQLGEGPGSRLLLIALSGAEPEQLAERSRELREALIDNEHLLFVGNGEDELDSIPDTLRDYRYLLSPGPSEGSLSGDGLRDALQSRLRDLASPAAGLVAPLMASDPTLETLRVVERWTPPSEPVRFDGLWFSSDQSQALLVAETRAAGFDPQGQQAALQAIRAAYAALPGADLGRLEISGPGAFAERMAARTSGEAGLLGGIAGFGLLLLLSIAYRSLSLPLLGALPLASGAISGLVACTALFGEVHGITLAFGFTLLGVAQDYPVHLFSHRRPGESADDTARGIWSTLATGAGSSCLAYLVFLFAGVDGLRQLAVFTVTGLGVAALGTRYLLPPLLPSSHADLANARPPRWMQRLLLSRHLPRWTSVALAFFCVMMMLGPQSWWQDDLASLTPVPKHLLDRDRELRSELAAPDVRWLLVQQGDDIDDVLTGSERLLPGLDRLVGEGVIDGYDLAARYTPSAAVQRARQQALPDAEALRASLQDAQAGLPFKGDAFDGFLDAVERARSLPPLAPSDLADTPLALRTEGLLHAPNGIDDPALALVTLSGVHDPNALAAFAAKHDDLSLMDLKGTAESLASTWRGRVLAMMGIAALLLAAGITLALRSPRRAARVLLPVALGTALIVALLHAAGVAFNLFHLVSMVLAAGLGMDYALFFERVESDAADQRRTLHSLMVCATSTLLVFALLGSSEIPVLRAIGSTVALGVVLHFLLAALLAARPALPETTTDG
ncbi:MAG: MMPL family transporter [Lysobacteraceae bacterium]